MKFTQKKPCADCPFIVGTSMVLSPGRMVDITQAISGDDFQVFPCHKTTNDSRDYDDEGDGDPGYKFDGSELACIGALAYTMKHHGGMLPVMARIACARGQLDPDVIRANFDAIEAPGNWPTSR